jgi:hypothetical protein
LIRLLAGTFARVWLVRLANPRPEDRNKVFALKVLKKVDGMCSRVGSPKEHTN